VACGLSSTRKCPCRVQPGAATAASPLDGQEYETREPLETEILSVEQSGTREWARYTAVTVRLVRAAQRGHSFRWRVYSEG